MQPLQIMNVCNYYIYATDNYSSCYCCEAAMQRYPVLRRYKQGNNSTINFTTNFANRYKVVISCIVGVLEIFLNYVSNYIDFIFNVIVLNAYQNSFDRNNIQNGIRSEGKQLKWCIKT